jgi:hypothetical protein
MHPHRIHHQSLKLPRPKALLLAALDLLIELLQVQAAVLQAARAYNQLRPCIIFWTMRLPRVQLVENSFLSFLSRSWCVH